eukprot:2150590-Rhodomonas_salina.1
MVLPGVRALPVGGFIFIPAGYCTLVRPSYAESGAYKGCAVLPYRHAIRCPVLPQTMLYGFRCSASVLQMPPFPSICVCLTF